MGPLNKILQEHPWLEDKPDEFMRVMVGVDLGQVNDPSAIVVAEAVARDTGKQEVAKVLEDGTPWLWPVRETSYLVRHVERVPLRTPYRQVGRRVADIVERLGPIAGKRLLRVHVLADATGLGRPVVEEMRLELGTSIPVSAVTITAGEAIAGGLGSWEVKVPKPVMVSRLSALLQRRRIEFPESEEARLLAEELKVFHGRATSRGFQAEAMAGHHDDLVIALGLAVVFDPFPAKVKRGPSIWR